MKQFLQTKFLLCATLVGVLSCWMGCNTAGPFPPINLAAETGWREQHGQAIWQCRADAPELPGEFILLTHYDGRAFVQFSQVGVPIVTARLETNRWRIEFPSRKLVFSGGGKCPARFGWLQYIKLERGQALSPAWKTTLSSGGKSQLKNLKTGEVLEMVLLP